MRMEGPTILNQVKSSFLNLDITISIGGITVVDLGSDTGLNVADEMPKAIEEAEDLIEDLRDVIKTVLPGIEPKHYKPEALDLEAPKAGELLISKL